MGLLRNNVCVLGFCIIVYSMMLARAMMTWAAHRSGGGGGGGSGGAAGGGGMAGAFPWAQLGHATVISMLNTVANGLALAVLQVLVIIRLRAAQQQQRQQQQKAGRQQVKGRPTAAAGSALGHGTSAPGAVLRSSDVWAYRLGACVAGPAVLLLCNMLVLSGATPLDAQMQNIRTTYALTLIRAVIVPCLQQLSTWEAMAAAPLLGLAEAILVLAVQQGWHVWRAAVVATAWRLGAVVVSAAWEGRSRRRFGHTHRENPVVASGGTRMMGGVSSSAKLKAA